MTDKLCPLALKSAAASNIRAYHLVFDHFGWATFYVDDERGTLAVESDWGSWAYRWGRGPWLGVESQDLSQALLRFADKNAPAQLRCDYIACKLFSGERDIHDEQETERAFRREVLERRRQRALDRVEARALWNALDDVDWSSPDDIYYTFPKRSADELGELWDYMCAGPRVEFRIMREQVLPAFIEELRKDIEARSEAAE